MREPQKSTLHKVCTVAAYEIAKNMGGWVQVVNESSLILINGCRAQRATRTSEPAAAVRTPIQRRLAADARRRRPQVLRGVMLRRSVVVSRRACRRSRVASRSSTRSAASLPRRHARPSCPSRCVAVASNNIGVRRRGGRLRDGRYGTLSSRPAPRLAGGVAAHKAATSTRATRTAASACAPTRTGRASRRAARRPRSGREGGGSSSSRRSPAACRRSRPSSR